jgi:hypothetical protein
VRLPDDHEVIVWSEDGLKDIPHADALQLRSTLMDPILHNPARSIGRDVLRYWYASGDREHVTGCCLSSTAMYTSSPSRSRVHAHTAPNIGLQATAYSLRSYVASAFGSA